MKWHQVLAFLFSAVTLIASLLIYLQYSHMQGFPDGYITELGRAQRQLGHVLIGISLALGAYFTYLGILASRKRITYQLGIAAVLYFIVVITAAILNQYYQLNLPGSGGG
jgi:hypothetical protein